MQTTTLIQNCTPRAIYLPATESFERGITLVTGDNNVPNLYLEELEGLKVTDARGKERYPGRDELERLKQSVPVHSYDQGTTVKPQIIVYKDGQAGRTAVFTYPNDLTGYSEEAAKALIESVTDKAVMERWAKNSKGDVKSAAVARLRSL